MYPIEYVSSQESFYDFCLWEYKPLVPHENKFSSATLLFHSFDVTGVNKSFHDLVRCIREGIGLSRTVWGIKLLGNEIKWEFYFYDYRRKDRERSITRILKIIRPYISCNVEANEALHYFMFSLDISDVFISGGKDLDEIHTYVGNPGSSVSSGICYSVTQRGTRMENFYFFFDAKREGTEIIAKTTCSAYIDSRVNLNQVIWPEMQGCRVIVVANKQQNDSIYFSGINISQLIYFLRRLNYPFELVSFIEKNKSYLDHLQYDVGFDYRLEDGKFTILKSGYYGVF